MKRAPLHQIVIPVSSAVLVLGILVLLVLRDPRGLPQRRMSADELLAQAVALVEDRYIRELDDMEVAYDAIRGVIEGLDPYSQFYDPRQKQGFQEETEGKFGGIGVSVRPRAGYLVVQYPMIDSPAERAGVRACDRFVEVEGKPLPRIETREDREYVVGLLKGEPGQPVRVTVESPAGDRREVEITREAIPRRSIAGVEVLDPEERIGYLHIKGFQDNTVAEFDEAMQELVHEQEIRALVVDLRFNPGGVLSAAIDLADRFLDSGTIVSTRGRSERASRDYRASEEGTLPEDLALVVLINGDSASASEVFAGAILDHRRGVLVGEPTYGKGVVQNVVYLNHEEVVLKVTSAAYFTPSGRCIEKRVQVPGVGVDDGGILPDVIVRGPRGDAALELRAHLERPRPGEDYREDVVPCPPGVWLDPQGGISAADPSEGGALPAEGESAAEPAAEETVVEDVQLDRALALIRGEPIFQELVGTRAEDEDRRSGQ